LELGETLDAIAALNLGQEEPKDETKDH